MIIKSLSPARISLFGGSTDLDVYSHKYGGLTISLAINLYQHITFYTAEDLYNEVTKIPHGIDPAFAYSITKSNKIGSYHHCVLTTSFDGVIGAGIGSSGAFGVGLISAIKKSKGERLDRNKIAQEAWIEENKMWVTGKQDQYASSFGGFNIIKYGKQTEIIPYSREIGDQMTEYLYLFYTGGSRQSAKMQKKLNKLTPENIKQLNEIKDIALLAAGAILEGKMDLVGKLLHATWEVKKKLGVSNEKIDKIYSYARVNGALGGKLLGAGECGYMLFFVPPERSKDFVDKMGTIGLEETDFSIDYNGVQARII